MSSLLRRIQRKKLRTRDDYSTRTMPHRDEPAAYSTIHPTKGWRRYSYKRVEAGARLNAMITGRTPWILGRIA